MSFQLRYRTLFEVDILHWYFLNDGERLWHQLTVSAEKDKILKNYTADRILKIAPLSGKALKNYRMLFKKIRKGFKIAIEVDEEKERQPKVSPDGTKLIFKVEYNDGYFLNYTALPLEPGKNKLYYFNNLAGAAGASFPSLSLPYPDFNSGDDYEMDSLVNFSSDHYRAGKNLKPASKDPDKPNSGWSPVPEGSFVSGSDQLLYLSSGYRFLFPSSNLKVNISVTNEKGNTVVNKDLNREHSAEHLLDLSKLTYGKHHMTIADRDTSSVINEFDFYYYPDNTNRLFGIIEIFVHAGTDDYDILDASKEIRDDLVYELKFNNRHTLWRYLSSQDNTPVLETPPKPLSYRGFVKIVHDSEELPNPTIRIVKPEKEHIVSEIFINA